MNNNNLNAAQLLAVQHTTGPAMILAGPGSGKTTVIAWRLKYLIEKYGADPGEVLVITFTRAAVVEMQYRFMKITDSSYPEVSFGTFHSIFYQIIKSSNQYKNSSLTIINEPFKYEIIRDILSRLRSDGFISKTEYEDALEGISDIISEISRAKNTGKKACDMQSTLLSGSVFERVFEMYNRRLSEFGRIDFDDMIIKCYELLSRDQALLSLCRKKYRFIMIDEYQDINLMQHKVIELLMGDECNVFAVGDDDQSIYGFRGADPRIMLGFPESFGDRKVRVINLSINYRCGEKILGSSLHVIGENKLRFKKEISAAGQNPVGEVVARRYESRERQNEQIAFFLKRHMDNLSEIAILTRTNKEAEAIASALDGFGIPSNLEETKGNLYESEAVRLVISYLSFAYGGRKRSDFLKIMNHPMRYISRESISGETVNESEVLGYYRGNRDRIKAVKKLFTHINMIGHLRPLLAVKYIRKTVGVDELFPDSRESLDEFEREASFYEDMRKLLSDVSERLKVSGDKKKRNNTHGKNVVKLLTMHASKGLEFKIVWIPDLNEGIIPSRSAGREDNIEEERRMLYVAMTRAKQALIMSYITGDKDNPMLPSRFLRPIKSLWDAGYQTSSEPSSGRSTSSSNSTSSR